MVIYKDIFTDNAVFSDAYNFTEVDGILYVVEGHLVDEAGAADENLVGVNSEDIGEDDVVHLVPDLIRDNKLEETPLIASPTDLKKIFSRCLNKLLAHVDENGSPAEKDALKNNAPKHVSDILKNYEKYSFYTTENDSYDMNGMVIPYTQEAEFGQEKAGDPCKIIVFKFGVY